MKMPGTAMKWQAIIKASERHYKEWHDRCDEIAKKYALAEKRARSAQNQFQLFWANIEVLKPAIYARTPVPVVKPRFTNTKRHVPRRASEVLERTCVTTFERIDIDGVMKQVRDGLLKFSRGVSWVRYEAEGDTEEPEFIATDGQEGDYGEDTEDDIDDERGIGDNGGPELEDDEFSERVVAEFLPRKRFGHNVCNSWDKVDCVWRIDNFSRQQMIDRFLDGESEDQDRITKFFMDMSKDGDEDKENGMAGTYKVYQLWCRSEGKVFWLHMDKLDLIEERDANEVLQLEGFFPCPMPVFGTLTEEGMTPIPDYVYYEDQIDEINELTGRIAALSNQLRMRGFYNSGNGDLKSSIEKAFGTVDNNAIMVPIKDMTAVAGQALSSAIAWVPIDQVATVIKELVALRRQLVTDVYEIVGISDIQRGSSDPNETLGAQRLKAQNGSVRVRERQLDMQRHARDLTRIIGEVIAENFDGETLMEASQFQLPRRPEPPMIPQFDPVTRQMMELPAPVQPQQEPQSIDEVTIEDVVEFLRDQRMRAFACEIETDSTIQPDEDAEKSRRTEFMTALGAFMEKGIASVNAAPETAPLVAESLRFVVGGFRAGRALEGVIDELADQIEEKAKQASEQPQQEQPNPELIKLQSDVKLDTEKANSSIQIERVKAANQLWTEQFKAGVPMTTPPPTLPDLPPVQLPPAQMPAPQQQQAVQAPPLDPNMEVIERLVNSMNMFVTQNQNMNASISAQMTQTMQQMVDMTADLVRSVNRPKTMELLKTENGDILGSREITDELEDEGIY